MDTLLAPAATDAEPEALVRAGVRTTPARSASIAELSTLTVPITYQGQLRLWQ